MCNDACLRFVEERVTEEMIKGKNVLEIGSRDINGTPRTHCMKFVPLNYIGMDIIPDKNVEIVHDITLENVPFVPEYFDVVITTEMLEHVEDWRQVMRNMWSMLKPGGYIVITTRSKGFGYHGYPHDYWRYEIEDMHKIFQGFENVAVEPDTTGQPGVFVFARKPMTSVTSLHLNEIELYHIQPHK